MRKALMLIVTVIFIGVAARSVGAQSAIPDPAKWESSSVIRVFEENASGLLSGVYRRGGANNGASTFTTNNDMSLRNPNSVQAMEATVTLLDASAVGSGFPSFPRAGVEGFFYWDGTGTGASTDQTGHVIASINLAVNATTGKTQARYFAVRCNDPACNTNTSIAGDSITPVSFFEAHRLKVSYDGTNFSFQVDGGTPLVVTAPHATRLPPTVPFKALRTRVVVPASPTASASILALFEDLTVNGAPYEDFSVKELPRVQILPGSGTFPPSQSFDGVIMVETAGEPVSSVHLTVNGTDMSNVLPLAVHGTLPSGGVTYRFPSVTATTPGLGTPTVIGVEATTASGKTARGFALWNVITTSE